jgi:hypothetical protein
MPHAQPSPCPRSHPRACAFFSHSFFPMRRPPKPTHGPIRVPHRASHQRRRLASSPPHRATSSQRRVSRWRRLPAFRRHLPSATLAPHQLTLFLASSSAVAARMAGWPHYDCRRATRKPAVADVRSPVDAAAATTSQTTLVSRRFRSQSAAASSFATRVGGCRLPLTPSAPPSSSSVRPHVRPLPEWPGCRRLDEDNWIRQRLLQAQGVGRRIWQRQDAPRRRSSSVLFGSSTGDQHLQRAIRSQV